MPKLPLTQSQYDGKPKHYKQYDSDRGTSAQRGYDRKWRKIRRAFLNRNPLCIECLKQGRTKPANTVHHIIPLDNGGTHKLDNLLSVCRACHEALHNRFQQRGGG